MEIAGIKVGVVMTSVETMVRTKLETSLQTYHASQPPNLGARASMQEVEGGKILDAQETGKAGSRRVACSGIYGAQKTTET